MVKISNNKKIVNRNVNQAIALLYSRGEESTNKLFWEGIDEPYREILEDCYYIVEEGKFNQLKYITNSIKSDRLSYIKLGIKIHQVKFYRLYQEQFNSFKEYCELAIRYPVWRANQVIEASAVAIKLIARGFTIIPQNESQARILTKLDELELYEKWQEVLDLYPPHKITAMRIEKVVFGEIKTKKGHLKLPIDILREIENKALDNGLSPSQLISKIFQGEFIINTDGSLEKKIPENHNLVEQPQPEMINKWEKDLQQLAFSERVKIDQFAEELAEELKHTVSDFKLAIKQYLTKSFLQLFFSFDSHSS